MAAIKSLEARRRQPKTTKGLQIVVAAPKGGVGKTTIIMNILVAARRAGLRAIGVNMDEQQTLEKWQRFRTIQTTAHPDWGLVDIPIETGDINEYRAISARLVSQYDLVMFDIPPGHSRNRDAIANLCEMADLVLIPTSASEVDLDEVIPFRNHVAGDAALFVLNRTNSRTREHILARNRLVKSGRLCPIDIPQSVTVSSQYRQGIASGDLEEKSGDAFAALWDSLAQELGLKLKATAA